MLPQEGMPAQIAQNLSLCYSEATSLSMPGVSTISMQYMIGHAQARHGQLAIIL